MTEILPTLQSRVRQTQRPESEPVIMRQDWSHLLFLHWCVPADILQKLLPDGLTVDTFDGNAYLGLIPFTMRNVRPIWSPSIAGLSHFHEINVRTYVSHKGEPGVWFFSLDAANPIAVMIARILFHLPYFFAAMTLTLSAKSGEIEYATQRRHPGKKKRESYLRYSPEGPLFTAKPGTLDYFLCERYLLYSCYKEQIYSGRVYHTPYPLQQVTIHEFADSLIAAAGFPGITDNLPIHAAYASGVSVEIFGLKAR